MTDLYLFRNDLRLEDNPALSVHGSATRLLCVYAYEPTIPWCQTTGLGAQRARFLDESVAALQRELRERGQDLLVLKGRARDHLPELVQRFRVARVGMAATPGTREEQQVSDLRASLPVPVLVHEGNTLLEREQVRRLLPELPSHYTPFRKKVEEMEVPKSLPPPRLPPPPPGLRASRWGVNGAPHPAYIVRGGNGEARRRLDAWLYRERAVEHYAETRNDLEGLYFASGMSPWLAMGSISARAVFHELSRYESRYQVSESSLHLRRELLWREFFQWRAFRDPSSLFRHGGAARRLRRCTFEPRAYARWCAGDTDYPLVNALMHQLIATGWMSNRGRQIAASCLINELDIDWRYGAAFFEKHLIDYDVASNYGNWQYIAGMGADPRGGRHFDLEKQARFYDPEGEFTARWDGYCAPQPEFVTDAADWPISP